MNQRETKGHGFFRKSKAYGLVCGIALAGSLMMANTASADEVVETTPVIVLTDNPATNLPEAQPETPEANRTLSDQAGTQTGEMRAEIASTELNTAVSEAKEAGVSISIEASSTYDNLESAKSDLAKQEVAVKEATAKQEVNTKAIDKAVAENKKIDQDNKAELARVEQLNKEGEAAVAKKNAEGQKAVDEANKAGQEAVTKRNEAGQKAVDDANAKKKAEVDALNEKLKTAYDTALAKYEATELANKTEEERFEREQEAFEKAQIQYEKDKQAYDTAKANGAGDTTKWKENVTVEVTARTQGTAGGESVDGGFSGESFMAARADRSGNFTFTHDMVYATNLVGNGVLTGKLNHSYTANADGSITAVLESVTVDSYTYVATGFTHPSSFPIYFKVYTPDGTEILNIRHNGMSTFEKTVGKTFAVNKSTIIQPGRKGQSIQFIEVHDDWEFDTHGWGYAAYTNNNQAIPSEQLPPKPTPPTPPKPANIVPNEEPKEPDYKPFQPEVFKPETFRPAPFVPDEYKPVEPNITPNVPVPPKETYKVAVHPVFVSQKPSNDKGVVNSDLVSVDGKLVAKGELVAWELTNESLKAGRETITAYTMSDPLPAGFNMDKELTAKNNPDWIVASDEVGNTIISATKTLLHVLNKDLSKAITIPKFLVYGRTTNDGATYENTFKTTITTPKGSYTVTSDTPVIYTPGNNPNTPRNKGGEDPTPNDNLIKPEKDVVDDKGNSINGMSVLPNTKLNYVAKQDFDQYKGMTASKEAIGKGFAYIDDYLDVALDGKSLTVNAIKAANGDDVRELLEMHHVLSMETIDTKLAEMVKNAGISPVGEFYMWVAKDPEAFYKAYVQKGLDITYNLSFEINKDFTEGDITNQTFQIDFGNGYYGNVVTNHLPLLSVKKHVTKDNKDLDGKEVKLGDEFEYVLSGWVIPANRGYDISEYRFVDKLQVTHDAYKAFEVVAKVDITLADGTVLKTGTDLAKYADQVYNAKTGLFELKLQEAFLAQIPRTSEFGATTYLTVKRIKAGEVTNEFQLFVNDNEVISNKVVTTTPEPPQPTPAPEKVLPKTGDGGSLLGLVGSILSTFGLAGLKRKK